jgi:uncharacterized linocin/CFP29 family protein
MINYGRDALWDAPTWADLDQAVLEEVNRVRVARKVFRTEDLSSAGGGAPPWVSVATIKTDEEDIQRYIPEGEARPFVEISAPFWLTPTQADAEDVLHMGRTLARAAAKNLALAEDHVIFTGVLPKAKTEDWRVVTRNAKGLKGLTGMAGLPAKLGFAVSDMDDLHEQAQQLVDTVNGGVRDLASDGWQTPYALILSPGLYAIASRRLHKDSEETPMDQLKPKLRHCLLSSVVPPGTGILVSLAGDPTIIYAAGEPSVTLSGEELIADHGAFYRFRVSERVQYAVTDPKSIRIIPPVSVTPAARPEGSEKTTSG